MQEATTAQKISDGHMFLESPRWRDGCLYAADIFGSAVLRWDANGEVRIAYPFAGEPSGLGWTADGDLLAVAMDRATVVRWDGEGFQTFADLGPAVRTANDMIVDSRGIGYVGQIGWDWVADPRIRSTDLLRVDADGSVSVAAAGLVFPNGMALSADERTLYVAETFSAIITAFDRDADGTLSGRRIWASLGDQRGERIRDAYNGAVPLPDGIALDAEGAIWIGDPRGHAALRIAKGGDILESVSTGAHAPYAVALGGADGRTLFICANIPQTEGDPTAGGTGLMMSARVDVPGV